MTNAAPAPQICALLANLPLALASEVVDLLFERPGLRIERIVSTGQASPPGFWYDQDEEEWVVVLSGWGTLAFVDGTQRTLRVGESLTIPAHCRHRITSTAPDQPTVWLAVFHRVAEAMGPEPFTGATLR